MNKMVLKICLLLSTVLLLGLAACSSPQPDVTVDDTPPEILTAVAQAPDTAADGYPAYPASGNNVDANTLNRPDVLPTFPGQIAFSSNRLQRSDIFILEGQSGQLEKVVTTLPLYEPAWSPDCQEIAMTGELGINTFQLFIGTPDPEGAPAAAVTTGTFEYGPTWSPDGTILAYQLVEDMRVNICFADAETGQQISCMENPGFSNAMPAWSPDGTKLVFASDRTGNYELFTANYPIDGNVTQLTNNPDNDYDPEFSPDGSRIVYASRRTTHYDIYTIDPSGGNEVRVTTQELDDKAPTWVGNEQIAFVSDFTSNDEIYIISAAGGEEAQQLTYNLATDSDPVWCAGN